jgi:hypothetical protein
MAVMIRHTVAFTLVHPLGSAPEEAFLEAALVLSSIPGVRRYEQLRQVSPTSDFTFGFSMEFDDETAYRSYNEHPDHVSFVQSRWLPEVAAFQELDFLLL